MADVEVSYENTLIKSLSASGQAVLHTAGKYCDDDITIDYTAPGGGVPVVIASGTMTGTGTNIIDLPLGTKAPLKDFYVEINHKTNQFLYDTDYKVVLSRMLVPASSPLSYKDHQNDYDRYYGTVYSLEVDNSGTITTQSFNQNTEVHDFIRNNSTGVQCALQNIVNPQLRVYSDHINIYYTTGNNLYKFVSGDDYEWKLVYFGGDPTNDMIEV